MKKGTRKTRVLLSFVGTNDEGKRVGKDDGAILTIFQRRCFDEVHLLWNPTSKKEIDFESIATYVRSEIEKRDFCDRVTLHRFDCENVTDHNEIYPKLLSLCRSLGVTPTKSYTAAIASGTPAMQVCWILIAESGDFPLELIRSNEPRFGKPYVTPVRLGTGLPRILRLEQANLQLQKEKEALIPALSIEVKHGRAAVGDTTIELSPIMFAYYRYFAERAKQGRTFERISGIYAPHHFLESIVSFHRESFPESELFRDKLEKLLREGKELDVGTFRANIVKTNTKIKNALRNATMHQFFTVTTEGKRHSLSYGLRLPPEKIVIKK
ncbi:MAG: hypothetical protein FJ045_02940 [Crenarchaeota archaeon]|nr:hypothetical protein [Thermoproteota archaeon]